MDDGQLVLLFNNIDKLIRKASVIGWDKGVEHGVLKGYDAGFNDCKQKTEEIILKWMEKFNK